MGDIFTICWPLIGTISADNFIDFKLPFPAQLIGASFDGDTQNFQVIFGIVTDTDAYINTTDGAVTAGTVTLLDAKGDFVGDQYPHLAADTVYRLTFTHTGSNPVDVTMILYFTVG